MMVRFTGSAMLAPDQVGLTGAVRSGGSPSGCGPLAAWGSVACLRWRLGTDHEALGLSWQPIDLIVWGWASDPDSS
jgi:hypothetical protein